jgi:hypothetical protein
MPSLSLGIVGLPNVGKSTLFNALVKNGQAVASNYPFCTIEPNVGIVEVPDERIAVLADMVKPQQIVPAVVEFMDIAGIIKGASQGEGLGNKFLSHIRETAAIILVVRVFEHADVIHVNGSLDPRRDIEVILYELALADLDTVQKGLIRYRKETRGGDKTATACLEYAEKLFAVLEEAKPASTIPPQTESDYLVLRELQLLTAKPFLVVANVGENQLHLEPSAILDQIGIDGVITSTDQIIPICASLEAELMTLEDCEKQEFLDSYGLKESGLNRLVRSAYSLLNLQTYFTAGPKEVRAWTIGKGWKAPQAAGVIHTDFEKGFIRAEVFSYDDYVKFGGEQGAKEAGKMRLEGKEYIVQDGDIMHFRFTS